MERRGLNGRQHLKMMQTRLLPSRPMVADHQLKPHPAHKPRQRQGWLLQLVSALWSVVAFDCDSCMPLLNLCCMPLLVLAQGIQHHMVTTSIQMMRLQQVVHGLFEGKEYVLPA